jgi:serine phosphatase RsbU (regulator of sigma subunit)
MPASLIMATTRTLLRFAALSAAAALPAGLLSSGDGDTVRPGEVLAQVNEMCCLEIPLNMFVTCQMMVLDPASGKIRFANAGHNLPYQCSAQGVVELRATGMPLGLMPGMVYDEKETILAEGDCLVLYSDGLTEAHNLERDMYGSARLEEQLWANAGESGLIGALLNHLREFTGPDWEQEDDITCVVLKRT